MPRFVSVGSSSFILPACLFVVGRRAELTVRFATKTYRLKCDPEESLSLSKCVTKFGKEISFSRLDFCERVLLAGSYWLNSSTLERPGVMPLFLRFQKLRK